MGTERPAPHRIIWVLGKKLLPGGVMCEELFKQMRKAVALMEDDRTALMIISGGQTRAGFPSEAEEAFGLVPGKFRERVLLEKESRTTSENIIFVKKMLQDMDLSATEFCLVTGAAHEHRTRFYLKHLWPSIYPHVTFDNIPSSAKEHAVHFGLWLMAVADPDDQVFVPLAKRFLRNA